MCTSALIEVDRLLKSRTFGYKFPEENYENTCTYSLEERECLPVN